MKAVILCTLGLVLARATAGAQADRLPLLPQPQHAELLKCGRAFGFERALRVPPDFDPAAFEEINERWSSLGLPRLVHASNADLFVVRKTLGGQAYQLRVRGARIALIGGDDGRFYAAMTLAQLPQRVSGGWRLPCIAISDQPALAWRILSDDISRGPIPTMRYFKERIRTIAAFKMNGYSPYMEHVFIDPRNPLPAPADGITPSQLHELNGYAHLYHVALIPEQQTFAHMHNTLRWETYSAAAELPHGYLMSPVNPLTYRYLQQVLEDELAAVPDPPFFHIGSDEPSDLGRGQSQQAVAAQGDSAVYAAHVSRVAAIVAKSGARIMIWDDAIQRQPDILGRIPKNTVIINWKYGADKSFAPYLSTISSRGFEQMVAPGANNWNEIFPDLATALPNEERFINDGKRARVLGLFQTVWHDDGESLYEATWFPVLYAAAAAWEQSDVPVERFTHDFPAAFFGANDERLGADIVTLGDIVQRLDGGASDSTDYLFWADPLGARPAARLSDATLSSVRRQAEGILMHLEAVHTPLHANAARVMALAARRLDYLARDFQIGQEVRYYYEDAKSHAAATGLAVRGLFVAKYLMWELRDNMEELAPLYAAAWDYENRGGHRASVLERYHLAAQRAIERADRLNTMTVEDYLRDHRFPSFEQTMGLQPQP